MAYCLQQIQIFRLLTASKAPGDIKKGCKSCLICESMAVRAGASIDLQAIFQEGTFLPQVYGAIWLW